RTILFASYKQGFKSGGFDAGFTNGAIAVARNFDNTFREEKVSGGEGGVKFGGRNLTISIVGYRYDYKDLQVGAYDA
ncbi:TonB-dependent receptor, partial [Acinetobacter baumannii]